ncbi:hypothetical protein EMCG_05817 [[Emmonsia] crescens]|uniref:Fungal N-terminal domain-containing protein n=1 Tax=[Emmonsia] crescens TaxID=73230 RepID=A0A0G2ID77_9EURO|nr:hypothetical protein EMCG_05817 [Emmonsia crescens UAMH 3008]
MAEALALVGVAGAAVQFIDVGFKVVILAVSVSEKYSDAPQCVRRALDLVQQLLQVANATTAKATWQRPVSEPNGGTSSPQSLHAPAVDAPHNVAEAIWKSCTAQAKVLNEQLEPVLKNLNDTGIRRTWKQLLTVGKLKKIDQALNDMERWKTLLGVYMGQESLLQINQLQHGIAVIHDNIDQINANLRKTERTFQKVVSEEALERSASQIRELHTCLLQGNLLGGQQLGWLNPMPSSESRQEVQLLRNEMRVEFGKFANSLNTQHKTFYASPARSSLHPPRPKRANDSSLVKSQGLASAPDKAIGVERHFRRQNMLKKSPAVHPGYLAGARPFSCLGRRYNWTKIYDLASSKLIMQSHSTRCECCIEQHKHKSTSLSACYRQNLAFLSGVLEFNFFIKTASEGWSIGTSLRTQRRVKNLLSIYKWEYKLLSKAHYWPSDMRMFGQLLASIARRELLEAFNSGRASPDDVDRNGDTLLHILAYQYSSWHAAFYVPMISTLLEMGADPNAFNDSME